MADPAKPRVLTEWELWACANEMINQHGADAAIFAAQRADALFGQADLEGAQAWRSIVKRINQLEGKASGPLH
jgi:hypothetical protein